MFLLDSSEKMVCIKKKTELLGQVCLSFPVLPISSTVMGRPSILPHDDPAPFVQCVQLVCEHLFVFHSDSILIEHSYTKSSTQVRKSHP